MAIWGIDVNTTAKNNFSRLRVFILFTIAFVLVAAYFVHHNPNLFRNLDTQLCMAAESDDFPEVKRLISKGADVNGQKSRGFSKWHRSVTPLHFAARSGNLEMVKYLLRKGANPDLRTGSGHLALDFATGDTVRILGPSLDEIQFTFNRLESRPKRRMPIPSKDRIGGRYKGFENRLNYKSFSDIIAGHIQSIDVTWWDSSMLTTTKDAKLFLHRMLANGMEDKRPRTTKNYEWANDFGFPDVTTTVHHSRGEPGEWLIWYFPPVISAYKDENGEWWYSTWKEKRNLRLEVMESRNRKPQ